MVKYLVWGGSAERNQSQTLSMISNCLSIGIFRSSDGVSTHETINFTELQEGINKVYVTGLCYAAKLQSSLSVKFQSKYCRLCSKYCKLCHTSLLLQD